MPSHDHDDNTLLFLDLLLLHGDFHTTMLLCTLSLMDVAGCLNLFRYDRVLKPSNTGVNEAQNRSPGPPIYWLSDVDPTAAKSMYDAVSHNFSGLAVFVVKYSGFMS